MEIDSETPALPPFLMMDEEERTALQHKILDEYGITMDKNDPMFALSIFNAWFYHKLSQQHINDSRIVYGEITQDLKVALDSFIEGLSAVIDTETQDTIQRLSRIIEEGRSTIDDVRTQADALDSRVRELMTARLAEADGGIKNIITEQVSAMSQAMVAEAVSQVKHAARGAARPWKSLFAGVMGGAVITLGTMTCLYFLVIQPQQRIEQRIHQTQERALGALPPAMKEAYKQLYADEIRRTYTP